MIYNLHQFTSIYIPLFQACADDPKLLQRLGNLAMLVKPAPNGAPGVIF